MPGHDLVFSRRHIRELEPAAFVGGGFFPRWGPAPN
jgi:hypothetical protein